MSRTGAGRTATRPPCGRDRAPRPPSDGSGPGCRVPRPVRVTKVVRDVISRMPPPDLPARPVDLDEVLAALPLPRVSEQEVVPVAKCREVVVEEAVLPSPLEGRGSSRAGPQDASQGSRGQSAPSATTGHCRRAFNPPPPSPAPSARRRAGPRAPPAIRWPSPSRGRARRDRCGPSARTPPRGLPTSRSAPRSARR